MRGPYKFDGPMFLLKQYYEILQTSLNLIFAIAYVDMVHSDARVRNDPHMLAGRRTDGCKGRYRGQATGACTGSGLRSLLMRRTGSDVGLPSSLFVFSGVIHAHVCLKSWTINQTTYVCEYMYVCIRIYIYIYIMHCMYIFIYMESKMEIVMCEWTLDSCPGFAKLASNLWLPVWVPG